MKLKAHLVLLALAVLFPVTALSAFAIKSLLDSERKAAMHSMRELARASLLAVDQELTYALATANKLALSALLARGDLAGFHAQAVAANRGRPTNAILFDDNGKQLLNTLVPFGTAIQADNTKTYPRIQSVLEKVSPSISNLIVGGRTGRYVIGVEVPVFLTNGKRYVVTQWMAAQHLSEGLQRTNVPADWVITIYDRSGTTVARSRTTEKYVGTPPVEPLHELVLSRKPTEFQIPAREGGDVRGALVWSNFSGWSATVDVPVTTIEAAAIKAVSVTALVLIAVITCGVLGALILSIRMLQTLKGVRNSPAPRLKRKATREIESDVSGG